MNTGILYVWIFYFVCICSHLSKAQYHCYEWTAVDQKEMGTKPSAATKKAQCEKRLHSFTKGDNGKYTGCGSCWCCKKNATSSTNLDITATLGDGTAKILTMWCSLVKKIGDKKSTKSQC